jgi:hypothetical protein
MSLKILYWSRKQFKIIKKLIKKSFDSMEAQQILFQEGAAADTSAHGC